MWIIQIRIDESFIYMKKMRFLVGLLGVLLIGGIIGATENYVSPIITQSAKPVKSFYRYKKERLAEFSNGNIWKL